MKRKHNCHSDTFYISQHFFFMYSDCALVSIDWHLSICYPSLVTSAELGTSKATLLSAHPGVQQYTYCDIFPLFHWRWQ